jgi:putative two-component system response regulator
MRNEPSPGIVIADDDTASAQLLGRVRLKRYTDDMESAAAAFLALAQTIEARDHYTQGHCQRLARYARTLGEHLGLPADDLDVLHRGGFLHDIGKIAVPDSILLKPGPLAPAEYAVMKGHTVVGDILCAGLQSLQSIRPIVRHHHELLDGSGYPDSLRDDEIPLVAQIVGIVDVFDALTTDRPYRHALSVREAIAELHADVERGRRRADLVEAFTAIVPILMPALT